MPVPFYYKLIVYEFINFHKIYTEKKWYCSLIMIFIKRVKWGKLYRPCALIHRKLWTQCFWVLFIYIFFNKKHLKKFLILSMVVISTLRIVSRANKVVLRCLMVSTDQADPSCFYFRISWILMKWCWFYLFCPLHLVQGLRSNNIK